MSSHCKAAILHCIDFRFQEAINQFISERGLSGASDRIGIAGGVKNLGEVFNELSISERLHQVEEMYLINHQDCGAYGPEVASEATRELEVHTNDLKMAKKIIQEKYPNVKVYTFFVKLDKEFVEID